MLRNRNGSQESIWLRLGVSLTGSTGSLVVLSSMLASLVAVPAASAEPFIVNGSFEEGADPGDSTNLAAGNTAISGWTVARDSVDYVGTLWVAFDETNMLTTSGRSVALSGAPGAAGAISQTFATQVGLEYTVVFEMAGNVFGGEPIKELRVGVPGKFRVYRFNAVGRTVTDMGWESRSFTFTAATASTTLTFESMMNDGFGPVVDDVRVGEGQIGPMSFYEEMGPLGGRPVLGNEAEIYIAHEGDEFGSGQLVGFSFNETGPNSSFAFQNETGRLPLVTQDRFGGERQLAATAADLLGTGQIEPIVAWSHFDGANEVWDLRVAGLDFDLLGAPSVFGGCQSSCGLTNLNPNANPHAGAPFQPFTRIRTRRALHLATGQLDEDPQDEVVVAWWDVNNEIRVAVLDAYDADSEPGVDTLRLVTGSDAFAVMDPAVLQLEANDYSPFDDGVNVAKSALFALTVGDFDGDLIDEIVIVLPGPLRPTGSSIVGFDKLEVEFFEFVPDLATPAGLASADIVLQQGGVIARGGGGFDVPICQPASTAEAFTNQILCGSPTFETFAVLDNLVATAANLPGRTPQRVGVVPETLVVATEVTIGIPSGRKPATVAALRPKRKVGVGDGCPDTNPAIPAGDFCLPDILATGTNRNAILRNTWDAPDGDDADVFSTKPSPLCIAAANIADPAMATNGDEVALWVNNWFVLFNLVGNAWEPAFGDSVGRTAVDGNLNNVFNSNYSGGVCDLAITDLDAGEVALEVNQEWRPEIVLTYTQTESGVLGVTYLLVYSPDLDGAGAFRAGGTGLTRVSVVQVATNEFPAIATAVADYDGDRMRLGPPERRSREVVHALTVLSSPPVHFDVDPQTGIPFEVGGCFLTASPTSCGFSSAYSATAVMSEAVSHSFNAQWGVSNETTASANGFGVGVEASLRVGYGESFGNSSTAFQSLSVADTTVVYAGEDRAVIQKSGYDIWEYPICAFDEPFCDGSVSAVVPSPGSRENGRVADQPSDVFLMTHEPGNLLSYKPNKYFVDLCAAPGGPTCYFVGTPFTLSPTSTNSVDVTLDTGSTDASEAGSIFSVSASVSVSGGIGVVDVESTFSASYDQQELSTTETSVRDSQTLIGQLGNLIGDGGGPPDTTYAAAAIAMYSQGAVVLDWSVDPTGCVQADPTAPCNNIPTNSMFNFYNDVPDWAMRLPHLRDADRPLASPDVDDQGRRTTEILLQPVASPTDPNPVIEPGATVRVQTRVHNYSLVPAPAGATVELSYEIFVDELNPIASLPLLSIPARGTSEVLSFDWDIPADCAAAAPGADCLTIEEFDRMRLFASVQGVESPENPSGLAQIHADNDRGWRGVSPMFDLMFVPEPSSPIAAMVSLMALGFLRAARLRGVPRRRV